VEDDIVRGEDPQQAVMCG